MARKRSVGTAEVLAVWTLMQALTAFKERMGHPLPWSVLKGQGWTEVGLNQLVEVGLLQKVSFGPPEHLLRGVEPGPTWQVILHRIMDAPEELPDPQLDGDG